MCFASRCLFEVRLFSMFTILCSRFDHCTDIRYDFVVTMRLPVGIVGFGYGEWTGHLKHINELEHWHGFYSPCLFLVAFCMYVFILDIASDPGEVRRGRSSHVCSNCRERKPHVQIRGAEAWLPDKKYVVVDDDPEKSMSETNPISKLNYQWHCPSWARQAFGNCESKGLGNSSTTTRTCLEETLAEHRFAEG